MELVKIIFMLIVSFNFVQMFSFPCSDFLTFSRMLFLLLISRAGFFFILMEKSYFLSNLKKRLNFLKHWVVNLGFFSFFWQAFPNIINSNGHSKWPRQSKQFNFLWRPRFLLIWGHSAISLNSSSAAGILGKLNLIVLTASSLHSFCVPAGD